MKLPAFISSGRLLPASVCWIYVCVCVFGLTPLLPPASQIPAKLLHLCFSVHYISSFSSAFFLCTFIFYVVVFVFVGVFFFLVELKMSPLHLGAIPRMCTFCYAVLVIKLTNKRSRPNTFLRLRFLKIGDPSRPAPNTWGNKKRAVSRSSDLHNHIRRPFGLISLVCATFGRRED